MRNIFLCVLGILSLSIVTAVSAKKTVQLSDKPILVKSGVPEVIIRLPSNPTTGYSWFLSSYDAHLIQPLSYQYIAPKNKMMGASGESVWKFRVLGPAFSVPHVTTIHLTYARPWSLKDSQEKTITVITQ